MKTLTNSLSICICLLLCSDAVAAKVEVTWQNPKEYRDIRPTSESRKGFEQRVFNELEEYMAKTAKTRLPAEQTLRVTVTDIDLAGQVWPASFVGLGRGTSEVRVIKRIDIPRMAFSYQLLDADGAVLNQADVDLKDMAFHDRGSTRFGSESFRYEKNMLKRWFNQEFPELIAAN